MWFAVQQEKPDVGTVIFKADDYYERLQLVGGMWNNNKYLYYEMISSPIHSSSEHEEDPVRREEKQPYTVDDITDVPQLLAYLELAHMNGALPPGMAYFMWDLHKLYMKKMHEYGHAIHWMSKKDYQVLENREKWQRLLASVDKRVQRAEKLEEEVKWRKRRLLKPPEIKQYFGIDSPPEEVEKPGPGEQTKQQEHKKKKKKKKTKVHKKKTKKKGKSKKKKKRKRKKNKVEDEKPKTQWQLYMKDKLEHPCPLDFGQTTLYDKLDIRIPGKHWEFTRFYHKLSRAIRFSRYQPVNWRTISLQEVDKHRFHNDCWTVLKGKVFDITEYLDKHPGDPRLIMQGAGVDCTYLFDAIHPYVVFDEILSRKQIGTLPFYREHWHTPWEKPAYFDICRSLKEWIVRPRNPYKRYQPSSKFKQLTNSFVYKVSFPSDLISREEDWSLTIVRGCQVTILKYIDAQYVWYGGFDLRNRVIDDTAYRVFSDDFNTLTIELMKPYKLWVRNALRNKRQDDGFFFPSFALPDTYRATLVERSQVAPGVKLYGISVGLSQVIGCPIGWYINIRLQGETRPYTPVCLPDEFEEKFKETVGSFQTLFFIIKEFKDGDFTSMLHHLPTTAVVRGANLALSFPMGSFQLQFLYSEMDTMLLIAGGTGISVMTRIIQEYVLNKEKLGGKIVILLFFAQHRADLIWKKSWVYLAQKYPWFHVFCSLTRVLRYSLDGKPTPVLDDEEEEEDADTDLPPIPVKENPSLKKSFHNKKVKVGASKTNNDANNATIWEYNPANPHELYGYPAVSKLEHIFNQIPGANGATTTHHKACVCGPAGFNFNCDKMLKEFGKHSKPNIWYFAA